MSPQAMSNNFEKRFRHHLLQRCGVNEQLRILVGLSGGADSVALLHLLKAAGHTTIAAHCNFNLRGSESDADEAFVRGLCRKEGIEVHVQRDRKSTRLNSSHVRISYAVFCLKKKKKKKETKQAQKNKTQ